MYIMLNYVSQNDSLNSIRSLPSLHSGFPLR